MMNNPAEAY